MRQRVHEKKYELLSLSLKSVVHLVEFSPLHKLVPVKNAKSPYNFYGFDNTDCRDEYLSVKCGVSFHVKEHRWHNYVSVTDADDFIWTKEWKPLTFSSWIEGVDLFTELSEIDYEYLALLNTHGF